jgi:plasmanylethanolamine desaturase
MVGWSPGSPLPELAASSRRQQVWSGVAVALSLVLLVASAVRLALAVRLAWWVPLALAGGIATADLASGLIHWGADTWGRSDLPVVGRRVLLPFRLHHVNPDDFLRRSFLDTNGDVAAAVVPILALLLVMPLNTEAWRAAGVFGFALCAFGGMTNQIHQWAHQPSRPVPVRVFQRLHLFLTPLDHAAHHAGVFDSHYCITTGWWNRPLSAARFFRRLEQVVTRVTGALPRSDDQRWGGPPAAHRGAVRHG